MWGGSEDDDMTGGHNVSGGHDELGLPAVQATLNPPMNDLMDGGSGDDAMAGDNAIVWRRGDDVSPRLRTLTGEAIYTTGPDGVDTITTNVGTLHQSDPDDAVGRDIELLDHADTTSAGLFGADVMAGGADSDVMFGQLADDLMQGDGYIGEDDANLDFVTRLISVADSGLPDTTEDLFFNVPELDSDADDYMEGNGGEDLMYGGLGQDDIIGGSSALFGLTTEDERPDGADIIYGGAGAPARLVRNDFVGLTDADEGTDVGVGAVPTGDDPSIALEDRHSRDADFVMGDNANVFRLVKAPDDFLTFNYDTYSSLRIVPRAMQQLDYTLGGADYAGGVYLNGAADPTGPAPLDNGAADLIHGESGDDYIFGMTGSDVIFGESDDDDIVGGYGNDWISGGTGQDGVIGDDGLLYTSRNSTAGEPLYGIEGLLASDANAKYNNGNALNEIISTPGEVQYAVINVEGQLKKSADLVPFSLDPEWLGLDDEFPDDDTNTPYADDIIFGGLGSDFLHGGSGDDAISGAEALEHAFVPTFGLDGEPNGVLDLGYNAFDLPDPVNPGYITANPNPGNVLAFNPVDLDGQHLNNRFRAGEFFLYDEYDPLRKIRLDADGNLWKDASQGDEYEFLLDFDETEGVWRASGQVPKATGQQTESYGEVNDDGKDAIFGDLGNDWLVGGTGRDNLYGGWGNDLLNADDDLTTMGDAPKQGDPMVPGANDVPDTHPYYEDRAYGGAGRDILIGNTGGDRLIDWVGEYNSYLVPYAPFGQASVSRTLMPHLHEFLYALSDGDGADPTRYSDAIGGAEPAPTNNNPIPSRNGEPHGELGLVLQKDFAWQDQTGAPADPQAGNIPGGKRDVLRSAGFNDGSLSGFAVDSGKFAVEDGKLGVSAESLGLDATAVLPLDDQLPGYYELLANISVEKPTAGWKANSYIVFDYFDEYDFKFAGINISTNKVEIGYRDASGWHVAKDAPKQMKGDTPYNLMIAVNGTNVTLVLDNKVMLNHAFAPRSIDGEDYGLNLGLVGLGSDNSRGTFDNFTVQRVPPAWTLQQTEDFASGAGTLFDGLAAGSWSLAGGRYAASGPAFSLADLGIGRGLETDAILELSAMLSTDGAGGFVFDRYADDDYKFVSIDAAADAVVLGHVSPNSGLTIDASFAKTINAGPDYTLTLRLKGTSASLSLGGQVVGGFVFNGVTVDGDFGLLASQGTTSFDSAAVKTSDRAFYVPGAAMLAAAPAATQAGQTLTQSELDSIASVAISQWTSALGEGDTRLAALGDARFAVADLAANGLGHIEGSTILVDADAAGHGWFVDVSPAQSSEFRVRLEHSILAAVPGSEAYGAMDLVTVVTHELGHLLGFDHGDAGAIPVMREELDAGLRYLLEASGTAPATQPAAAVQSAFAGGVQGFDLAGNGGANVTVDWQANSGDGWNVKLSPYAPDKPAQSASPNFAGFLVKLFNKDRGEAHGGGYDSLGRALLGKDRGR
jgi:Ca2+-binding RTX toxin-like protein